jgi:hypothetical protein
MGITKYFVLPSRSTHILFIFVAFLTRFVGCLRVWSEDFRSGNLSFHPLKPSKNLCFIFRFFSILFGALFSQVFVTFCSISSKLLLADFLQVGDIWEGS